MFEFEAIGTHWWLENLAGQNFDKATRQDILQHVHEFDAAYSRFKDDSLISVLNTKKYLTRPPQKLLDMFALCHELHNVSDGIFDISVGGVLHAQGYGSKKNASHVVPNFWNEVTYDRDEIRIPDESVIDTGGYGKGWLIDELTELLHRRGYKNVIVNGGGDLRIINNTPVEFVLEHPYDVSQKIGSTKITNGALAVSGAAKRQWKDNGKTHTHLVDPTMNDSVQNDVAASYVQTPTATIADCLATIVFIRPDLQEVLTKKYEAKIVVLHDSQLAS